MNNSEDTEVRAKLTSMSWVDLRKEAKLNGVKANMKKAALIEAVLQKMAAKQEASGFKRFDINPEEEKAIGVQKSSPSHCTPVSVKPSKSSVQFKFGSASPSRVPKVFGQSILKRSSMSADRTCFIPNATSERMDHKPIIVGAPESESHLSRVGSTPGADNKLKHMVNSSGRALASWEKSEASRGRPRNSCLYSPYSGPFRYKDTTKMRGAELIKYNHEKHRHQKAAFDVVKDAVFDVVKDATFDMIKDATFDMAKDATFDMAKDATFDMLKDATFDVLKDATFDVLKDATFDVIHDDTSDVIRDATYDVIRDATYDVKRDTTFEESQDISKNSFT